MPAASKEPERLEYGDELPRSQDARSEVPLQGEKVAIAGHEEVCPCSNGTFENSIVVMVADDSEQRSARIDDARGKRAQGLDETMCGPAKLATGEDTRDLFENCFRGEELDLTGGSQGKGRLRVSTRNEC